MSTLAWDEGAETALHADLAPAARLMRKPPGKSGASAGRAPLGGPADAPGADAILAPLPTTA